MQYLKCWELSEPVCLTEPLSFIGGEEKTAFSVSNCLSMHLNKHGIDSNQHLFFVQELTYDCATYKIKDVHVIDFIDSIPVFFEIRSIFQLSGEWYLWGNVLATKSFCSHFHSYNVNYSDHWHLCGIAHELTSHPLDIHKVNEKLFVRLRYVIPGLCLWT